MAYAKRVVEKDEPVRPVVPVELTPQQRILAGLRQAIVDMQLRPEQSKVLNEIADQLEVVKPPREY